jgi:DNA-3-methyladenine glycosylase II
MSIQTTPDYWKQAQKALVAADPMMAQLIARYDGELLRGRGDAFYTLARSIAGQQISVKAADAVWARVEAATPVKPQAVLEMSEEALRTCGLSRQKILYLKNIAEYFLAQGVDEGWFAGMDDAEVIRRLSSIKGVGKWTAEMFLIFHLLRPDVWPIDDIGVQKAVLLHYDVSADQPPKAMRHEMTALATQWQPWRSVAVWYLWRSLDPLPVAY